MKSHAHHCKPKHAHQSHGMLTIQHQQAGFTLVELMIAMLLGLLIIGGVIAVFLSNKQSYSTNNAISQVQDSARTTFELLSRDIRETGLTGCGNLGRIANTLKNGPNGGGTVVWYADMANAIRGFDSSVTDPAVTTATSSANAGQRVGGTSSIQLVGGDGVGLSVTSHNTTNATITLNETASTLAVGDYFVICDPDHAAIAQATSLVTGPPIVITAATGTGTGNCSTGLGFPTQCATAAGTVYEYITNSQVSKLYAVDWYIGFNPLGKRSLYRMAIVNNAGVPTPTAQEMVRDVTNMEILYHMSAGTSFVNAAGVTNWATVDAVMITLTLESVSKLAGTKADTPITRRIPITVTLRNRMP